MRAPKRRCGIPTAALIGASLLMQGCSRQPQDRVVYVRTADVLHVTDKSSARNGLLTHDHPRLSLAGQTRTVLAPDDPTADLVRVHAGIDLDLPASATMDLAYGLPSYTGMDSHVRFSVTVGDASRSEVVFERTLAADEADSARWHDARIDLSQWVGPVSLDFTSSLEVADGATEVFGGGRLGVFSTPVVTAPRPADRPKPPNVILVSLDTLRADHLGLYGYERSTSPFMDDYFAEEGLIVERAYTQGADTLLGHTAMLYGADPCVALMRLEPRGRLIAKPWQHIPSIPSLAELLRRAGYRTAAYTENAMVAAEWGFARGFEVYDEEKSTTSLDTVEGHIRQTFDRGLAWLDANSDAPFFLFLHTYQVHNPYEPPSEYAGLFHDPGRTAPPQIDIDGYDREIRYTDDEIRRLVGALAERGLLDDTILVITSDHGEEFDEHGGRFHSSQVYEEILRVPLLIRAPGRLPQGVRREGPVLLLDLAPTLLDLVGVAVDARFDGMSVRAHLAAGTPLEARSFIANASGQLRFTYDGLDPDWIPPTYAAVRLPWKLVRKNTKSGYAHELYDVVADPRELHDRYAEATERARGLEAILEQHTTECAPRQAGLLRDWGRPVEQAAPSAADAERLKKLKALGYVE